jgi:hypothetical protein
VSRSRTRERYMAVVARCGGRCSCTGSCGRHRRCSRRATSHRLVIAPADPSLPLAEAVQLPDAELIAWCGICHDLSRDRGLARRADAARQQAAKHQLPLFAP